MDKVKEELKNLEIGIKLVLGFSDNIGVLQVCVVINLEGFDFVVFDWLREDEFILSLWEVKNILRVQEI